MKRHPRDIVVGFRDRHASLAALHFALNAVRSGNYDRLIVAHATTVPVSVDNGPSAEVANRLGNPTWSAVHSVVDELGADPRRTLNRVVRGRPAQVLASVGRDAALVVLGRRRRWHFPGRDTASLLRHLIDTPIVRVATPRPEPATARSTVPSSTMPVARINMPGQALGASG